MLPLPCEVQVLLLQRETKFKLKKKTARTISTHMVEVVVAHHHHHHQVHYHRFLFAQEEEDQQSMFYLVSSNQEYESKSFD
jgi:hypothetical protein